jgi:mycothiol synthase
LSQLLGATRNWSAHFIFVPIALREPLATSPHSGTVEPVHLVEIVRPPIGDRLDDLTGFVEAVGDRLGHRPLSDHLLLDLRDGGAPGFVAVRVADHDGTLALAQISTANAGGSLEIVVDPALDPVRARRVHDDAARTAVDAFRRDGGGRLTWWLDDPDDDLLALAVELGLAPVRTLHEMRRRLPAEQRASVTTRDFRPGVDDEEWVRVNNRAFADHGGQGGWTTDTLRLRQAEPWFDPAGFRVHERDGRIAAFCWTKLHDDTDPVIGEIYVIAVDPDFHGEGLGKQLTLAGLDSIADRGVTTASLHVDADNTAAFALYDRLGFTIHHTRRACAGDLEALETT